jgi:hypothetical protein
MGKVWLDTSEVGAFEPQYIGATGIIFLEGINIGSFAPLTATGNVYLDAIDVGDYTTLLAPPPPASEAEDARYRTRVYLNTYLDAPSLTKDDGATLASYVVIYANPNYPLKREFIDKTVDLVFCVGTPDSTALPIGVGYEENVPITVWCIDKTGITGTKLRWKAEAELRRVTETYPIGSLRTLNRLTDNEKNLGSTVLYSVEYVLRYKRYA